MIDFRWLTPEEAAGTHGHRWTDFFVEHVTAEYLSPADVLAGRSVGDGRWHPELHRIVYEEIAGSSGRPGRLGGVHVAVGTQSDQQLAMAIVAHDPGCVVATIDDLLVAGHRRGGGIGGLLLTWIEAELAAVGVTVCTLESSTRNTRAHGLFENLGYEAGALVYHRHIGGTGDPAGRPGRIDHDTAPDR